MFIKLAAADYPPEKIAFFINMFLLLLAMSGKVGGLKATLKTKHLKNAPFALRPWDVRILCHDHGLQQLGMAMSLCHIFLWSVYCGHHVRPAFLGEKIGIYRWSAIITPGLYRCSCCFKTWCRAHGTGSRRHYRRRVLLCGFHRHYPQNRGWRATIGLFPVRADCVHHLFGDDNV